jgi:UDP-N-acetylglucosamine 2-epimerase (non-hydrolysing)
MKILSVVGARPNFVKIAPILRALEGVGPAVEGRGQCVASVLVHTEQHYDDEMSAAFFNDLRIPRPDHTLGVGSGTHAVQTAEIMRRCEPVLVAERPDVVVVVGDVNSTAACALTAAKLCIPVAHVEAGLRSFDRSMPEEINRIVTDSLSDFLFTTEESANVNLRREGHPDDHVFFAGNVMVDSLDWCRDLAARSTIVERLRLPRRDPQGGYALVTLHRPSNVDTRETLQGILGALAALARELPVILPMHPRTRSRINDFGMASHFGELNSETGPRADGRITLLSPVGYVDFFRMMSEARLVLTDSGGIQDETTCLGIPCLTLRANTERPVTVTAGTSTLVGNDPARILECARRALGNGMPAPSRPPLWDGHAAERIAQVLVEKALGRRPQLFG